ncbi:NADPH-dependent FMN reductase [Clostridium sp. DL-VIII]|uniref:flavodoxin family protein n=1 Tax=Clostridium sp. DL-VIII TaxID=641107 RepID=UPI00023B08C7|nr:flavodoxin family protein [Clostridium sp. DL-VIII]EHJ02241.1 NADPH-dependent FMN reductase [Clostridium sp. DL-VIII]
MKVTVITGSPRKFGTSTLLADKFIKGAKEAGHEIFRFDAAFEGVHPCTSCNKCEHGDKPCVFQDSMAKLYPHLIDADLIAFVTPLYFFGVSSQIKMAIDRFHGINNQLKGADKKAILMVTAAGKEEHVMNGVVGSYNETLRYLQWQDCGIVLANGCNEREAIEKTNYPEQAYQLGKKL